MKPLFTTTYQSNAKNWVQLADGIQNALFDAQHGEAGLHGAKPRLLVLLSRELLRLDDAGHGVELQRLGRQLQQQGVPHSFHCAAAGSPEPAAHTVQVTLD